MGFNKNFRPHILSLCLFFFATLYGRSRKKKEKKKKRKKEENSHIQMSGNLMLNMLKRGRDFSLTCLIIRMGDYENKHTVTFLNNLPELKVPF